MDTSLADDNLMHHDLSDKRDGIVDDVMDGDGGGGNHGDGGDHGDSDHGNGDQVLNISSIAASNTNNNNNKKKSEEEEDEEDGDNKTRRRSLRTKNKKKVLSEGSKVSCALIRIGRS